MKVFKDLTGLRFGRLIVLGLGPKPEAGDRQWVCQCDCGGTKLVRSGNLISGSTQSCGCLKSEVASRIVKITNSKQKGVKRPSVSRPGAAFRMLLRSYKKDAKARGYSFSLTDENVRLLTSSPCVYCGSLPNKQKVADSGEVYKYNGIDRAQNKVGYELSNCVPACTECNLFKGTRDINDFLNLIVTIFKHCTVGTNANEI